MTGTTPSPQIDPIMAGIQYGTPRTILKHSSMATRIPRRLEILSRTYSKVFGANTEIYLNRELLRESVENYFCDLYRLKFFRDIDNADAHKQAAFTMKWIAKTRPIQIVQGRKITQKRIILANEIYAFYAGINFLPSCRQSALSHNYIVNLIYVLHNHAIDPVCLASEMYAIDCGILGKNP